MTAQELREKFLKFFERNGHAIIPPASLVPPQTTELSGVQKVLFTTAGMHPLVPFLLGKEHPLGKRLTNVQKCLRTDDVDEVGDATHNTFFEMLGNWSLGDYWKKEAIEWSYEFLIKELSLTKENLAISVFAGDNDAPEDSESLSTWKSLGIPDKRIAKLSKADNWWGPVGETGPCGPDTEMFYWVGSKPVPGVFDPKDNRWVEIWNDVFMEYNKKEDGSYEPLAQRNVDTGMGLERTLMVMQGKESIYETAVLQPVIDAVRAIGRYETTVERIIADHLRAAVFLILDGVEPSNKHQGYILRRLIRRAAVKVTQTENMYLHWGAFISSVVDAVFSIFQGLYEIEDDQQRKDMVVKVLKGEIEKFKTTLDRGLKEVKKIEKIDGKKAFDLYQTYGFPLEVTEELFKQKGQEIDHQQFEEEFRKHQELSRTASSGMFKGGLAGHSEVEIKYHTATHLLHQALRDVLGPEVFQKGSNINSERLRFDFSFDRKLTDEEIKKAEEIINQKIREYLKVENMMMSLSEAREKGAIGLFNEKYGDNVSVYGIGSNYKLDPSSKDQRQRGGYYSLELCGGPHVEHTGQIGEIKITKEEAVSAGVRRIRAELTIS